MRVFFVVCIVIVVTVVLVVIKEVKNYGCYRTAYSRLASGVL